MLQVVVTTRIYHWPTAAADVYRPDAEAFALWALFLFEYIAQFHYAICVEPEVMFPGSMGILLTVNVGGVCVWRR